MGGDANIASRSARGSRASQREGSGGSDRRVESFARDTDGDRRRDSVRATRRRRAAEDALLDELLLPRDAPATSVGSEGQVLLIKALARLERQDDVDSVVAWSLDSDGEPRVIAARPADSARRVQPTRALYCALAGLERVQRLTDPGIDAELATLGEQGISAAAPVAGLAGEPAAVLLVYPTKAGGLLRPRTVAVLGEVAAKLARTLSTSLALERMARLDDAVQRLDRLAALGGLVSEIVHEIRNPLVSVKTFLQLLPDRLDDPEFHGTFRELVSDEVRRLERMLEDLLRHARPTPGQAPIEPEARIPEAIATTLQLLTYRCHERGIVLETDLPDELPALGVPEDALRQLLLNLLLNATEVTPEGGTIRVEADWSREVENQVELRVSDEGPGLESPRRERVFDPFWTTRDGSPGGLGLAICRRIVEQASGTIEVEEGRERGACFRISLPIAR